jgi:ATP-dependent Clp protease ATP-binding subunit ClpC
VDKGWDPAMGARPLRRAIQRYIEDPLADEVLRAGEITPSTTVLVDRDTKGDDEDRPLTLKLVKPRKKPARKKQPAGVGGRGGDSDAPAEDAPEPSEPEPEPAE